MTGSVTLVGRAEELGFVQRALRGARAGVVVMGAGGVGKTRLARELTESTASAHPGTSVWVSGTRSAGGVPFGAFAHLLPALDAPPRDRLAMSMLARRAVLDAASDAGLLVVDDAHLLDDASAVLVQQLAMTHALRLVVTVRSGEHAPDAVVALWKDGWLDCVDLQPLDRVALGELVAELVDGRVDPLAVARIWEQTRGNALFCRELVRASVAADRLVLDGDVWRWRGGLPATGRIWDLIDTRLSELDPEDLEALEVVAVADRADTVLLEGLVDRSARLRLTRRGLVEECAENGRSVLALSHPLFGEVVRSRMVEARRIQVCGWLADAADAHGMADGPELLRVAGWRLECGGGGDRDLLLAAARRALAGFDSQLAERFARAAFAAGGGFEAELELATALGARGELQSAEELFMRLERDAELDAQRAAVAAQWSEMMFLNGGRAADAANLVSQVASELVPGRLRDELQVLEAVWRWLSGDRIAVSEAEWRRISGRSDRMRLLVAFAVAPMRVQAGRIGEALALLDGAAEAAANRREALPTVELALRSTRAYALWSAGRLNDDLAYCERELAAATAAGEFEPTAMFAFGRGGALADAGRIEAAIGSLRDGLAVFERLAMPMYVSWSLAVLARALALGGDAARAREALERAERARPAQIQLIDPELGIARVWVLVAEGDMGGACVVALELADRHVDAGRPIEAARALHALARLGRPDGIAGRLCELAAVTDAPILALYAAHARGLADDDAASLHAAGEGFEALGCLLLAAEAFTAAAVALRAVGRAASARAAGARAAALLARCEGARTPALAGVEAAASLTRRERDVAVLAAHGIPNREIAQRLVVSVRTVESHLAQTYRKLGVSDRRELAELMAAGAARTPDHAAPA
jgi:DNA-binding NarL/FixJ family response regulator